MIDHDAETGASVESLEKRENTLFVYFSFTVFDIAHSILPYYIRSTYHVLTISACFLLSTFFIKHIHNIPCPSEL